MILAQNHAALESIGRDQWAQVYGDFYTRQGLFYLIPFVFPRNGLLLKALRDGQGTA